MPSTDRIEREIQLRATRSRVWRALTNAAEFGQWFRVKLVGEFAEGARVHGQILYPGYEHLTMELLIECMQFERLFSYRWHPYAIDSSVDYSVEPMTLVEFQLEKSELGTKLIVVESGFDRLSLARRTEAFRMNDGGWAQQMTNIERHVSAD